MNINVLVFALSLAGKVQQLSCQIARFGGTVKNRLHFLPGFGAQRLSSAELDQTRESDAVSDGSPRSGTCQAAGNAGLNDAIPAADAPIVSAQAQKLRLVPDLRKLNPSFVAAWWPSL